MDGIGVDKEISVGGLYHDSCIRTYIEFFKLLVQVYEYVFYTVLVVTMNIVYHHSTNLIAPEDIPNLTPESIRTRVVGSKLVLVVEQSMIMTIWGCKACLLCMYMKLT
ncbi:family decarboxylase protein [Rutstroemia sp. NJR-2017a BBW]|nr:family decarboxylase protein [Rutstroemia sp. NJR-2017a BBW]